MTVFSSSLIVGADQAAALPTWHRFDRISELARIIVVRRADQLDDGALDATLGELNDAWGLQTVTVDMPLVPISSTRVREVASTGDRSALRELVPPDIVDDVLRLYGPSS